MLSATEAGTAWKPSSGWVAVHAAWQETVATTPQDLVDAHVGDEWSLTQTLRHLILATDAWLRGGIERIPQPFHEIGQIFTGERSVRELGGPVKIAQYSGQQFSLGWLNFVSFAALISINLAFINLLPIPALDGGHLAFYAAEAVRRLDEPTLLFGMGNLKGDGMAFIRMARSWTMREEENE